MEKERRDREEADRKRAEEAQRAAEQKMKLMNGNYYQLSSCKEVIFIVISYQAKRGESEREIGKKKKRFEKQEKKEKW